MLKPTRENQRLWVERHLNGGEYSGYYLQYNIEIDKKEHENPDHKHACYGAMQWLDESNVKTLAEAWRRCQNGGWMAWMLYQMEPTFQEERWLNRMTARASKIAMRKSYTTRGYEQQYARALRKMIPNPWIMKNWRAGLEVNS
jgi:hypothetical protein